ncbi:MAG: YbbR-like domain-containing protein [Planctomycetota bacterium]|jgi:hypothetical protein
MLRNVKLGKIFAVISLSALVWIWADLASDEQYPVYSATVNIVPSQPELWVSFEDGASVSIREIVLKGPAARTAELNRRLKQGERLEFDFDAAQANMGSPGSYSLSLQGFLQRDKEIKRMGLKVESCKPEAVSVTVSKLVKRLVEVQCRDEANNPVTATVSPTHVNVLLPEDWPGPVAYVQLTENEKSGARQSPIPKRPYVPLADDRKQIAERTVAVTIPSVQLPEVTIQNPRLGFIMSKDLHDKYSVDVESFIGHHVPFNIRATLEAKSAYENQDFQLLLVIKDTDVPDVGSAEYRPRTLEYNFPDEFVRKGQIDLPGAPSVAQFRLIERPIVESGSPPVGDE